MEIEKKKETVSVQADLPMNDHRVFKAKCAKDGISIQDAVRFLVKEYTGQSHKGSDETTE